ncbi:Signal transduction histidine kinase [Dethiosulfatibacter aminovorans DSM 17477]|uniref:histidine kinase n=1 Tax=Dethiosulfatibacter aminovorans DSM 17477 TaxID=1121476 RepID=A0A1M6C8R2_9FIRM|nr:HAMP domain-containing sensor histidine kinase [Dethiosulfatibacter aminovorans]SHI57303.1 Signal transduction histidine kinase [Dethiosulfatibacter aminovorans DSM 17477]
MAEYKRILTTTLMIITIAVSFMLPGRVDMFWGRIIHDLRESIVTGNTGHLILASAINGFVFMLQAILLFVGTGLLMRRIGNEKERIKCFRFIHFALFLGLQWLINGWMYGIHEPVTALVASSATFGAVYIYSDEEKPQHFIEQTILTIQFFYAFQWLNSMPALGFMGFGVTDIPSSIKMASLYQGSESIMNFTGLSFFIPLVFSGIITKILYVQHRRSVAMAEENIRNQQALATLKSRMLENMVYEEINTLTHDLKTPLVTIRGLNSLLTMTDDSSVIGEYSKRIEGAAIKMNEMISGFLYESSRQITSAEDLMNYVRAQIPLEDERIRIDMDMGDNLPKLHINKIRVSRALVNIIENAIVIPTNEEYKKIDIRIRESEGYLVVEVEDNGIGIPVENLDRIWEAGYSSKDTTGLGLAFVKKVIEDNLGDVRIDSRVNEGTIVTMRLPGAELTGLEEKDYEDER